MGLTVSDRARVTKRGSRKRHPLPVPTVSQRTRERWYLEASTHPAFEGTEEQDVRAFIDSKLENFLSKQPCWYGHIGNTRHHAAQRQYMARKEKVPLIRVTQTKTIRQQGGDSEIENRRESQPGEAIETRVQPDEELVAA